VGTMNGSKSRYATGSRAVCVVMEQRYRAAFIEGRVSSNASYQNGTKWDVEGASSRPVCEGISDASFGVSILSAGRVLARFRFA
jgi:hypothetical protein